MVSALAHAPREAEKTCANAYRALTWCHLKRHNHVIRRQSCEVCVVPLFISDLLSILEDLKSLMHAKRKEKYFFSQVHSAFLFYLSSQTQKCFDFTLFRCQALSSSVFILVNRSREVWAVDNNPTITITFKYMRIEYRCCEPSCALSYIINSILARELVAPVTNLYKTCHKKQTPFCVSC